MLPSHVYPVAVTRRTLAVLLLFVSCCFTSWSKSSSDDTSQVTMQKERDQTERAKETAQRRLTEIASRIRLLDDAIREANAQSGLSENERNKRLAEFEIERKATLNESNRLIGILNRASRAADAGREFSFSEEEIDAITGRGRKSSRTPWVVALVLVCVFVKFLLDMKNSSSRPPTTFGTNGPPT
jgi:TolA-binding protein